MSSIETFWQRLFSRTFTYYKIYLVCSKYHNLGLLGFYEMMSLANFEILSGRNFEN